MCSEQSNKIHSRICVMCERRFVFARMFCELVYRVYSGEVCEYRAFNAVVCSGCWYVHAADISAGYYGRCVKEKVGV
jgi:hypothetical protein